jgi:hypothetical protein
MSINVAGRGESFWPGYAEEAWKVQHTHWNMYLIIKPPI